LQADPENLASDHRFSMVKRLLRVTISFIRTLKCWGAKGAIFDLATKKKHKKSFFVKLLQFLLG